MRYRPSRRLIIAAGVIVTLAVAFVLLLPEIVRRVAINWLGDAITAPVSIADVDLNLFSGRAHVESFVIGNAERPILSVPAFALRISPLALLTGQIDVEQLVLQKPVLTVERTGDDRYNVLELVNPPSTGGNGAARSFSIDKISIQGGEIAFIDRTRDPDYKLHLVALNLTAGPISTLPADHRPTTGFQAGFKIGDGSVTVSGASHGLPNAPQLELTAELSAMELEAFHVYLPYGARLNLKNSLVNGHARYAHSSRAGKTVEQTVDANLTIGGFGLLTNPAAQPSLVVSGLQARDVRMDFIKNQTTVGTLILEKPDVRLERNAQGWNLAELFRNEEAAKPPSSAQPGAHRGALMALNLQHVEANNGTGEFIDRTVDPMVARSFHNARIVAKNVSVLPSFAAPDLFVNASVEEGMLQLAGAFDAEPFSGQFTITGKTLPLDPFRGYLNQLFGRAQWNGDALNGNLKLALATQENDRLATEISGSLTGQNLTLRFPGEENPFLSSRQLLLDLRTVRLGANPRVDIEAIKLLGADLRIVRNRDGSLNLARLWTSAEKTKSKPSGGETTGNQDNGGTPIVIGRIDVEQSDVAIRDVRVSPNYNTKLSRLTAQISELSEQAGRAKVQLEGVLGESARLTLSGWFTPFTKKPNMHLEGTIESYALPPLNPYATEYISHRIERGQVTMEVAYDLKEGDFQADANIALRKVRVGERTGDEFSRRIGIPLELAVALLEDINGVIRLHLAVDGEGGPQFSVANLIWRAVRNALVKAVSAPFRLIGNVLTLGGRIGGFHVDPILFEPGMPDIQAQSARQLEALSKLLREKPQIELRLNGNVGPSDVEALKQKIFWSHIRAARGGNYQQALVDVYKSLNGVTQPLTPLSQITEASLERFVMEHIEIAPKDITELAQNRAELVRQELIKRGVDPNRLLTTAQTATAADTAPRVSIELVS